MAREVAREVTQVVLAAAWSDGGTRSRATAHGMPPRGIDAYSAAGGVGARVRGRRPIVTGPREDAA